MTREDQFRNAVNESRDHIFRICNYYFDDAGDRDDAFQESLIRIWQALPSFRGNSKMSTWIYRIVVNTCLSYFRSEKKRKLFLVMDPPDQFAATETETKPEMDEIREKKLRFFHDFLKTLSAVDRSLVSLYLEEVGTHEIADITGLSEVNVRVRIHRIKETIKKRWEEKNNGTRRF